MAKKTFLVYVATKTEVSAENKAEALKQIVGVMDTNKIGIRSDRNGKPKAEAYPVDGE